MPYYTYILECADGSFYVGCTNSLDRRIEQPQWFEMGRVLHKNPPSSYTEVSETFTNLKSARRREAEIKGWRREKKINLINRNSLKMKLYFVRHGETDSNLRKRVVSFDDQLTENGRQQARQVAARIAGKFDRIDPC